jgi:dATP pyrophosphohydrolase
MGYKQPRSVQVVIFTEGADARQYLLLRRIRGHGGFWQSVTGSLEDGETHAEAAVREVHEETGIRCAEKDLIDLNLVNRFEISPIWRARYAPGVTHNEEVCFALKVEKCEIRVDSLEHEEYAWATYKEAASLLYWNSSKRAFAEVEKLIN